MRGQKILAVFGLSFILFSSLALASYQDTTPIDPIDYMTYGIVEECEWWDILCFLKGRNILAVYDPQYESDYFRDRIVCSRTAENKPNWQFIEEPTYGGCWGYSSPNIYSQICLTDVCIIATTPKLYCNTWPNDDYPPNSVEFYNKGETVLFHPPTVQGQALGVWTLNCNWIVEGCEIIDKSGIVNCGAPVCESGYTGNYRCKEQSRQSEYKNNDCSLIWIDVEFCENGCVDGNCMGSTTTTIPGQTTTTTFPTTTTTIPTNEAGWMSTFYNLIIKPIAEDLGMLWDYIINIFR